MKKIVYLILFLSAFAYSGGPIYQYGDPSINQEIQNIYQDINNTDGKYIHKGAIVTNVLDYGADGDDYDDDTSSIQSAIDATPLGGTLVVPPCSIGYIITSQLNITKNRITILGFGQGSYFAFNPQTASTNFLYSGGGYDNVTYRNFAVTQGNSDTVEDVNCFYFASGATEIEIDGVFITGFSRAGIYLESGTYYVYIHDNRIIRNHGPTDAYKGFAILDIGTNVMRIERNYFAENDASIQVNGGTSFQISRNTFELNGSNYHVLLDRDIYLNDSKDAVFAENYVEVSSMPAGGASLYLRDTENATVRDNYFVGELGGVAFTPTFVYVFGTDTKNCLIENNRFLDVETYFINNQATATIRNNYYEDGGSILTTQDTVAPYIGIPSYLNSDLKTYATWDPPSISSGTQATTTVTHTGAVLGNTVTIYPPPYTLSGLVANGYVSAANTVTIVLSNLTSAAVDLGSGLWAVTVKKF